MLLANSTTPLYIQLCDKLRNAISNSELPVGMRLPSERLLAAQHGIDRGTARKAIRQLQHEGYVEVRQRRGYFVVGAIPRTPDTI